MIYTYTEDLPYTSAILNKREFYRLPRHILLPPYLTVNPYFVEFTDSIDEVFDATVEAKLEALQNIRNMWVPTKEVESTIQNEGMIAFSEWGGPDRAVVVSQVNLLGMKLASAGIVSEQAYRALAKFLGSYWFEKGKKSSIDFVNFCSGYDLTIEKLWTNDYKQFYPEGDTSIGAKIYDSPPGSWYPTTHVRVSAPGAAELNPLVLSAFFYEIANYNLVIEFLLNLYEGSFVDINNIEAAIVCMGVGQETIYNMESTSLDLVRHSTVGGWTGGVGQPLTQVNT